VWRLALREVWTNPDGVSECESDREGQTLRYGDDQHSDSNDKESHELLQVVHAPWFLLNDKRLDRETHNENDHCQNGHQSS